MKLSYSTRIRLVTVALSTFLTLGIGGYSTLHTHENDLASVDSQIALVTEAIDQNPSQALGAALFSIQSNSLNLSLALLTSKGVATNVAGPSIAELIPTLTTAKASMNHAITIRRTNYLRTRSVLLGSGDYIVVTAPADEIEKNFHTNIRLVLLYTLLVNGAALLFVLFYFRRLNRGEERAALDRMQEFLGDASHELRTPLTVVKGYVEMLSKGQLQAPEDQKRAFDRVGSEIKRMESLIQDLLLLAEIGESSKRVTEEVNLSELLSSHVKDFETLNSSREIHSSIEKNVFTNAPRDYLSRYIQNALTNISRHTPADAPVSISLSTKNKQLLLIIEDGGPGLPEKSYGKQMRSFNRFDPSRSRDNGGSGLGMSIMAAVISKLNGSLTLRKSSLGGLALEATLNRSTEAHS